MALVQKRQKQEVERLEQESKTAASKIIQALLRAFLVRRLVRRETKRKQVRLSFERKVDARQERCTASFRTKLIPVFNLPNCPLHSFDLYSTFIIP